MYASKDFSLCNGEANIDAVQQGRLCATIPSGSGLLTCCLPCPSTDWVYPDSRETRLRDMIEYRLIFENRLQDAYRSGELAQRWQSSMLRFTPLIFRRTPCPKNLSALSYYLLDHWCRHHVGEFIPTAAFYNLLISGSWLS